MKSFDAPRRIYLVCDGTVLGVRRTLREANAEVERLRELSGDDDFRVVGPYVLKAGSR